MTNKPVNFNNIHLSNRRTIVFRQILFYLFLNFIICFLPIICIAQPGPFGGLLAFKVYKDGKFVDLSNKNWEIIPNNITLADSTNYNHFYIKKKENYYYIIPLHTPAGAKVSPDFYFDIVYKKDTMRIYPPNIKNQEIELDSIPFKKGVYKIPQSVYDFRLIAKKQVKYYDYKTVPSLYDNWDLFTKETYKCYIEKTEDLDNISNYYGIIGNKEEAYQFKDWQYLENKGAYYYFNGNVIVKVKYNSEEKITIYEVKNYSDTYFLPWFACIPRVVSLFSKNDTIYAIIYKTSEDCGIFKLNFVDEKTSIDLHYLKRKQIIEEYEARIKGLKVYDTEIRRKFMEETTKKFDEIMKSFDR